MRLNLTATTQGSIRRIEEKEEDNRGLLSLFRGIRSYKLNKLYSYIVIYTKITINNHQ